MKASSLPESVEDTLHSTASRLSDGIQLWFGNDENPHKTEVKRKPAVVRATPSVTDALLHGWLYEVNWHRGTAQLHDYSGEYVQLRFSEEFSDDMLRLATQLVEVRGRGRFNDNNKWTTVEVLEVSAARSGEVPFDVEAFLNDPSPKTFDPGGLVTTSEPFDVDEFMRVIREGREVQRGQQG